MFLRKIIYFVPMSKAKRTVVFGHMKSLVIAKGAKLLGDKFSAAVVPLVIGGAGLMTMLSSGDGEDS